MQVSKNTYGWIGQSIPTQSSSANSGIFSIQDINDLVSSRRYFVAPLTASTKI